MVLLYFYIGALLVITINLLIICFLPTLVGKIILVGVCLFIICFSLWLAPQQLSPVGFASINREPDYLTYYLSYLVSTAGLLNLILIFSSQEYPRLFLAFSITAGLLLLSISLLIASQV